MLRAEKAQVIDELSAVFDKAGVIVVTHYKGLTVAELSDLRLGSRPAARGRSRAEAPPPIDALRAIPWTFAWTQSRIGLPGWYGLGTGLASVASVDDLRAAYQEWPLFNAMLDNAEMSLAKTDRSIAEHYLSLGGRPDFTEQVLEEYDRTRGLVLQVTGHTRLLENRKVLSRAVQLRDPYVDALSHLQLRALRALTAADLERIVDERWDPPVTLGVRLVSVLSDDLQHVGQAAYVRGLLQSAAA